jgi:hypothetical protein
MAMDLILNPKFHLSPRRQQQCDMKGSEQKWRQYQQWHNEIWLDVLEIKYRYRTTYLPETNETELKILNC